MTQELKSGEGVLEMTIEITRKATGKKEQYVLRGVATPEEAAAVAESIPVKENDHGCDPSGSCP